MAKQAERTEFEYFSDSLGGLSVRCRLCGVIFEQGLPTFSAAVYKSFLHAKKCEVSSQEESHET